VLDPRCLAPHAIAHFAATTPERSRSDAPEFRYEMLNRSAAAQAAIGHPRILEVIEPLLGDDCHVIANTAWRNPRDFAGGPWHCDAGPHIPRPEGIEWDDRIPYPIFAIGAHLLLADCAPADGPTMVVPGSHRSGRLAVGRDEPAACRHAGWFDRGSDIGVQHTIILAHWCDA